MRWFSRAIGVLAFCAATSPSDATVRAQTPTSSSAITARAFLDRHCVACHNERVRQSDLLLDRLDPANVGAAPEAWEKVVRKLRTRSMPPDGRPRPERREYAAVAAALESALDRAARPRPGDDGTPVVRRLSRTEYANAIRDLLGIDQLPKSMGIDLLLPADNVRSGFDNLADLLFVSPTVLEGYLEAARTISTLAIGGPHAPLLVDTYRLPSELPQHLQRHDLPAGTRGGTLFHTYMPADGEYDIGVDVSGATAEPHQIEVAIDGVRAHVATVVRGAKDSLTVTVPIRAGPHAIAVAFVHRSNAIGEEMVLRGNRRGGSGQNAGMLLQRLPALGAVTLRGPRQITGPGDTPSRHRVFICTPPSTPGAPLVERACARRIVATLARRAYRRPITDADLEVLLPFFEQGRATDGFDEGIRAALERMLVSPQFLFRIEQPSRANARQPVSVSGIELASRLSFSLWSSIPDEELLELGASGRLLDPPTLERQARRMLADPKAEALVHNFAAQWLFLRDLDTKRPDLDTFSEFDEALRQAFRRETELFLGSVLREGRSVLDLLRAGHTFLNERLAKHYGMPHIYGGHFRRVDLPEGSPRRGLLGHGSILLLTSYPTRTSPVVRGKWILDNLLGSPPPPPPPNVPALREQAQDGTPLSMREAMQQHRSNPVCASCHARMDPIGFALEGFDALGQWRTHEPTGRLIDTSSKLGDGSSLEGAGGLRDWLLDQPEAFVSNVVEKLLMYALGRSTDYRDMPTVRDIMRASATSEYAFDAIVLGVVKSAAFQSRAGSPQYVGAGSSRPEPGSPLFVGAGFSRPETQAKRVTR